MAFRNAHQKKLTEKVLVLCSARCARRAQYNINIWGFSTPCIIDFCHAVAPKL